MRSVAWNAVLEGVLVLVAFTTLVGVITWPLVLDLGSRIYGYPGDSTGTISFLWLSARTGFHLFGTEHRELTGAPFGWDFANAVNLQWAFVFGPAVLATKLFGEVVAYNLVVLSGLVLSGASMYLLVRVIGGARLVAAWAGLAYTIFPWHLEKAQGHVTFVHLEGFPLLVLAVVLWHRKPTWRRALLIAGASLVLWTTSGYFGLIALVALGCLLPVAGVFQRRRLGTRAAVREFLVASGISLAVPVAMFVLSLFGSTGEGVSAARDLGSLRTYGARPWEYFLPSYRNPIFGDDVDSFLVSHLHGSNFSETSLYVGWVALAFAAGFLIFVLARRRDVTAEQAFLAAALTVLGVVAVVFSLSSPLSKTDLPGPSRVLWQVAPQFRVPARFVALVMTALVPLAALGLEALRRALVRRPGFGQIAAVAVCLAAIVGTTLESWVRDQTTNVSQEPVYYGALARVPGGALAEYPLAKAEQAVNSDYLFWQREHHRRLVNGAAQNTFAEAAGQSVLDPKTPGTASELAAMGVSAIIVRPTTYAFSGGKPGPRKLGPGYRLVGRYPGDTSVWRVVAKPAPAISTFTDGFSFTEAPPGQSTSRWMISPNASVDLYAWRPGTYRAAFDIASYGRPRVVRISGQKGARVLAVSAPRTVSIPVTLPRGPSKLNLFVRPGPQVTPDGRRVTVYISNWRFTPVRASRGAVQTIPG